MAAVKKVIKNISASKAKTIPKAKTKAVSKAKPKTRIKVLKVNIQPTKEIFDMGKTMLKKEAVVSEKPARASSLPAASATLPPLEKTAAGEQVVSPPASREEQKKEVEKTIEKERKKFAPIKKDNMAALNLKFKPLNLYRKIAFSFVFLTLALLAVIFYFSFVRVSIILVASEERLANNLIVDIYDKDKSAAAGENAVAGAVTKVEVEETKTYTAGGAQIIGEEAVGRVVIVNNYIKSQPLVATTRLLAPDNKLFRTKDTVSVPAGGSVEVDIYADKPSPDMAIGPTKFTIPGLWAGIQDKIYAENKEPVKYQKRTKKYITQSDIDAAAADLKQILLTKAKNEISEKYKDYDRMIYNIDENSVVIDLDGKVGEEKDSFSVTMKTAVAIVAFPGEKVAELAREKLLIGLPDDKEIIEFNKENISYSLSGQNTEQGTAAVVASFDGKMALKEDASIIEREKLVGLTREQIAAYLSGFPEIAGYEINFSPSFIKKAPNLVDRIEIVIKK